MTHRHDLFYITVKYHDNIPKGIQVTEGIRICIKKHQREDNSKSITVRALIFVRDTSSCPVLHNCEVSSKYSKQYSSYRVDTKLFTDGHTDGMTDRQWTDTRLITISLEPFSRGIKMAKLFPVKMYSLTDLSPCFTISSVYLSLFVHHWCKSEI